MRTIDTMSGAKHIAAAHPRIRLRTIAITVVDWVMWRVERQRTRRALFELTDAQLKDIGISRSEAYREAIRSFWD